MASEPDVWVYWVLEKLVPAASSSRWRADANGLNGSHSGFKIDAAQG